MAIHHLTPPIRGGERPRLPSSQIGPVTQAIRAMRAAEPIKTANFADLPHNPDLDRQRIRDLRRRIAERIEADIALLDALDGDTDLEADYTYVGRDGHGKVCTFGSSSDYEGLTDDNGLCDYDALSEQGFAGYGRCA